VLNLWPPERRISGNSPQPKITIHGAGHNDFAVSNFSDNTISTYFGDGAGNFTAGPSVATGSGPTGIVAGHFFNDGDLALAVTNQNDNTVSTFQGKGDGTFKPQVTHPVGSTPKGIINGSFNGHGDLAVTDFNDNKITVLNGDGLGSFVATPYAVGNEPDAIIAGDFRGDGKLDLAVANFGDNTVSVLLGNGDGTFENPVTYSQRLI
jgi:hypothetical protein